MTATIQERLRRARREIVDRETNLALASDQADAARRSLTKSEQRVSDITAELASAQADYDTIVAEDPAVAKAWEKEQAAQ